MNPLLSVVITAYKDPEHLEALLEYFLLNKRRSELEIIVSVDEPGEELKRIVDKYKGMATFLLSEDRRGKVTALNSALSYAKGDIIIFLDSDVLINDDAFIEEILKEMKSADVMEIKKVAFDDTIIGKLVYYDYVSFGIASWIFDRRVGRCAGLNGAAIAFRRAALKELGGFKNCILEDMDIGFRSFFLNLRFKYFHSSHVYVDSPSTIKEWANQRLRWSQGAWVWLKEYLPLILQGSSKYPVESITVLIVMFPWILIFPTEILSFFPVFSGMFIALWHIGLSFFASLLPLVYLMEAMLAFMPPQIFFTLPYFVAYAIFVYLSGKKIGYKVSLKWLALYFFFYAPIWLSIMVAGFIRTIIFKRKDIKGWKI